MNPAAFDDTGFVQATALVGSFFPLGFLGGFDRLAHDTAQWVRAHPWFAPRHGFIFKLDSLLFNLGFISTALAVAFLVRPGMGRVRLWWGATAAVILLISLQQSRLYLLLFHVPFFDVFRAYFLYVVFVVMAALVMSAYGMDAYLTLPEEERRRVLVRSLVIVGGIVAICAPVLLWLLGRRGNPGSSKAAVGWLVADLMIAAAGAAVLWLAGRARATERWAAIVIVVLVLSQTAYFVGAYKLVGISLSRVVATYGLDGEDFTPVSADIASDPSRFHRKPCTSFAQCYASQRDTASIVRFGGEWGGAFWRSKDDAIFQAAVSPAVVAALSGVSHPVFWLSRRVVTYQHRSELVTRFNQHSDRISEYLREAVSVLGRDVEALKLEADEVRHSSLTSLERDRDRVRLTYDTDGATILNAAITFDPHWIARVNGQPAAVVRGNFNGLAIWLPAGTGTVELVYDSWSSRALFASRYVALLLAVIIVGGVTWKAIGRPGPS